MDWPLPARRNQHSLPTAMLQMAPVSSVLMIWIGWDFLFFVPYITSEWQSEGEMRSEKYDKKLFGDTNTVEIVHCFSNSSQKSSRMVMPSMKMETHRPLPQGLLTGKQTKWTTDFLCSQQNVSMLVLQCALKHYVKVNLLMILIFFCRASH